MAGEEGKGGVSFACDVRFDFGLCVGVFLTVRHCNHNVDVAKIVESGRLKNVTHTCAEFASPWGNSLRNLPSLGRRPLPSRYDTRHLSNSWVNFAHTTAYAMPGDRLLGTLLRSLQTYTDEQDTPR